VILIGRRKDLTADQRKRLAQFLHDTSGAVDVVTYDRILDIIRLDVHNRQNRWGSSEFTVEHAHSASDLRSHAKELRKLADYSIDHLPHRQ
jgi:hypothetical protein